MIAGGGGLVLSGDREMDLTLMPMHTVRVRVVDGNTNAPVQGAKISTNPREKTCGATFASGFASGWKLFPGASENTPSQLGTGYLCYYAPAGMRTEPRTDANGYVDLVVIDPSVNGLTGLTVTATHPLDASRVGVVNVATNADSSPTLLIPGTPSIPAQPVVKTINGEVQLSWIEPWNGGAFIDYYKVWVATDASGPYELVSQGSCAGKISPELRSCSVSGLTQGVTYYFAIIAHNEVGYSARSTAAALRFVVPTVPNAPTNVAATIANQSAEVSWLPPANDGDSPILDYKVSWSTGTQSCSSSPCTITGLTNGTSYTFQVIARNEIGDSVASDPSQSVIPATTPDAPTRLTVTRSSMSAILSWSTPANNGSAITGYKVSWTNGTQTCSSSPCTITGLVNGTQYAFSVSAVNAIGESARSANSIQVTPATIPGAPRSVSAKSTARGQVSLKIGVALANGDAIRRFEFRRSLDGGKTWSSWSAVKAESLTNGWKKGTSYLVQVRAVNTVGFGPVASVSFRPAM